MELSMALNQQIVDFLTEIPNIHSRDFRTVLIETAGLDDQLSSQIAYEGSAKQFSQALVTTLIKYGTLNHGRGIALGALLEATKRFIGQDKRAYCDTILQTLRTFSYSSSSDIHITVSLEIHKTLLEIHKTLYNEELAEFLQQLLAFLILNKSKGNLTLSS